MKKILSTFAILLLVTACAPAEEMNQEVPPEETGVKIEPDPTEPYLSWNLTSTDSLDYFPEISEYAGDETIKGWLEEAPVFGTDEVETLFRVSTKDMEKLPPPFQGVSNYAVNEEILDLLKAHDEDAPAKVRATAIRSAWEAAPVMEIAEIL